MLYKAKYIFILLILLNAFSIKSQGYYKDSLVASKIKTLSDFWGKYNSISVKQREYYNLSILPILFKVQNDANNSNNSYLEKVYDAKINQLKKDIGLSAVGNYQENFAPGFGSDDDLLYNRRIQAGLDWNILGDGYLKNRYKKQIIENESTINNLNQKNKISVNDYLQISHRIIYTFNEQKIKLLDKRQQIINDKIDIANELYLLKQLPKLEVMQIIQQQVDVSSMYQIYKSYNDQLKNQIDTLINSEKSFPVFDIDVLKISSFSNQTINDTITQLKLKNIELQNKNITQFNLRTQVRYNYYDLVSQTKPSRSFLSAGLILSVPLPLGFRANQNTIEAEKNYILSEQQSNSTKKNIEILNSIYEFRYKLKQYNNFFEKRKKYEELIRIERVKEKLEDLEFNPITALNLLDELLSIDIEMLDIQQEIYLQLLDITTKNPELELASLTKPYQIPETNLQKDTKQKAIYIWSASIEKYSIDYIEEYLRLNNINTAIVSIKKDEKNKEKYNLLFNKLKASNINIEILIGSNKLINNINTTAYYDSILSGISIKNIQSIHLDVEPHTFDDYQINKEKYLNQYVELLIKSKTYCDSKNLKLSVSIPVFYPENILKQIYTNSSLVYLMAYEHSDPNFIVRKVKEEFLINQEKSVIALRAKDFKDRKEFESITKELSEILNTTKFAMHDFETFVNFDQESVGGNKK